MTLAVAFIAGLVSCVSPCVLPVGPVSAGYVAGGTGADPSPASAPRVGVGVVSTAAFARLAGLFSFGVV